MRRLLTILVATLALGCDAESDEPALDGANDDFASDGKGDWVDGLTDDVPAATALRAANLATRQQLIDQAGISRVAADGIVAARPFSDLVGLDDVPYVGPLVYRRLVAWGERSGLAPDGRYLGDWLFVLDLPAVPRVDVAMKLYANYWDHGYNGQEVHGYWIGSHPVRISASGDDVAFAIGQVTTDGGDGAAFTLVGHPVVSIDARGSWRDDLLGACGVATLHLTDATTVSARWVAIPTAGERDAPPFCD